MRILKILNVASVIYIPLWFYSNDLKALKSKTPDTFTFHYGSILIWKNQSYNTCIPIYIPLWFYSNHSLKWLEPDKEQIYIPLWFYSNETIKTINSSHTIIYIPLWFYSNDNRKIIMRNSIRFTFHYGSILMRQR